MKGNGSKSKYYLRSTKAKVHQQVVPDDLVCEILVRLAVKPLVRFKCVSKEWYSLIENPTFIENQLKHGSEKSRMLLVMSTLLNGNYQLSFHESDSLELKQVRPKLPIHSVLNIPKSPEFLHCLGDAWSKGILCIMYNYSIRLWNPALRESKRLPPRPRIGRQNLEEDGVLARGFGITCTSEFKVILIKETQNIYTRTWNFPALLYSSSTNSWKRIGDATKKPYRYSQHGHVLFFNSACHWYASHIILSFNMTTEVFKELELPYVSTNTPGQTRPIVINDSSPW